MRRAAGALLLVVSLTACGSTVQVTSTDQVGGTVGGTTGLAGTTSGTSGTSGTGVDPSTSGTTGLTAGTTSTTGDGTTTGVGTSGSSSSTGGTTGPTTASAFTTGLGVTAKTITIGVSYTANGAAANAAIGGEALTTGDDLANNKALVAEINEHGGIAGRRLEAVYFAYDATSPGSGASQDQAACNKFTQDNKVLAVIGGNLTDVLPACLKRAGTLYLHGGVLIGDDLAFLRTYSNQLLLGTMAQDRYLADMLQSFQRQRYLTGWSTATAAPGTAPVKVAVVSADPTSFQRAVKGTLLPGLSRLGHPVSASDVFFVHKPQSTSDISGTTAQIKSATLRMQSEGVTHVVFNDASGLIMALFSGNASTQRYYPRFGVTSGAGPQGIFDAGLTSSKQLTGMSGPGWLPSIDLPAADGSKYATPATKRCLEIMRRRTGQTYTSTNAASIALTACDAFFLLQQALGATKDLSPRGLRTAVERLGGSFVSPLIPATRFSPTQHDSAVRAWDMSWVPSCSCVRYSHQHTVS